LNEPPDSHGTPDSSEKQASTQKQGRAEATQRILAAARALFVEQDPESVPIRRIAEMANVNHALVHRYFGTKDKLLAAVLEQEAEFFAGVVDQYKGAGPAARALFDALLDRGDFVTMLTRATLSGRSATRRSFESGALHRLVAKLGDAEPVGPVGAGDPRHAVAAYAALMLGWSVFREFLAAAVFLDEEEMDGVTEHVRAAATSLLKQFPAAP
jgi:AcrR family transcriptional regulator